MRGKRGVTPSTALRLARFLGMRAEYWLDLQARWDLCHTAQAEENALKESDAGHVARTLRLLDALLLLDTEGRLAGVRATAAGEGVRDEGRTTKDEG